jgi:hypothetical protein
MAEIEPGTGTSVVTKPPVETQEPVKTPVENIITISDHVLADGAGAALIAFTNTRGGDWYVQNGFAGSDSILVPVVGIYIGNVIDDTRIRDEAAAIRIPIDYAQPLFVPNGQTLSVVWAGCTPLANCNANFQIKQVS